MGMLELTPDMRIAVSMEEISRYVGEIKQLLQDLAARPEVDNAQLKRIATAVSEIQRVVPAMLLR
jgi:anti-sigma regulatory factor (Ser/Thr protein kinase)